jgi:hypothetical protein
MMVGFGKMRAGFRITTKSRACLQLSPQVHSAFNWVDLQLLSLWNIRRWITVF